MTVVPDMTTEQKRAATGGNTGNQLIAYSLVDWLEYTELLWGLYRGPERVNEEADVIVIAAANFLWPSFDLGSLADFIEGTDLPCVMVGVGAQSNDYDPRIPLPEGTERLMRVVAERTERIGVRGAFTGSVLENYGIDNFEVVGCPSFYIADAESLEVKRRPTGDPRFAINLSRDVTAHAFDTQRMEEVIAGLVSEGVRYDAEYVAQSELEELEIALGRPQEAAEAAARLVEIFDGIADPGQLEAWLRSRTTAYLDVGAWQEAMRSKDFVAGTRFHGCMAALRVGVPVFLYCHDVRTKEMAEHFCLPHASITDIDRVDLMAEYGRVDMTPTQARYRELRPRFARFLRENGLVPSSPG